MKGVIDLRFAFGFGVPRVERFAQRAALLLNGEVDDAGGSAVRGRDGAGLEVVNRRGAAERHVEVRVRVDAAGNDVLAFGVDGFVGFAGFVAVLRERGDFAVFDPEIGGEGIGRGDASSVFD